VAIAFIKQLGYRKVCLRLVLKIQKIQNNICAELLQHGVKEREADKQDNQWNGITIQKKIQDVGFTG